MPTFLHEFRQALRSLLRAQMYGVEAMDATSFLAAIGLLAFLIPVLRASRVNPTEALCSE